MKQPAVEVRLFATLRDGRFRWKTMEAGTVAQVLDELSILPEDAHIVLVNGHGAPLDTVLEEGDTLSLFPPVGGG